MESVVMLVKCLMSSLILCIQIHGNKGCYEGERLALLQFKASLGGSESDNHDLLPSWVVDDPTSDCCNWERVTCNSITGHVIELSLNNSRNRDYTQAFCGFDDGSLLNMSLFQQIKELTRIDLSFNGIVGFTENEEFKGSSNSRSKLEYLDLSWNCFRDDIFNFLSMFSSLGTLDLSYNALERPLFNQGLDNLKNWTVLKLRGNIRLSGNAWPIQSLCGLKRLEELDLSLNYFEGSIPECLNNLTSLRILDLSFNKFTGQITSSLLSSLKSLKYVDFRHNLFEGSFSFKEFANHSSLEVVKFISDNNKFKVVTEYPYWVPPFQLQVLILETCGLRSIPEFLSNQFKLNVVDLSHNRIKARFPNWLSKNNAQLDYLNLRNNCFYGEIYDLPTNISWLDLSRNCFGGMFAGIRGNTFPIPNMKFLNLSNNNFHGDFPFLVGEKCKLIILDMSSNNFTGEIPAALVSSCISLSFLKLSDNNFQGQIFPSQLNLTSLWLLQLSHNQFVGTLPSLFTTPNVLRTFDISNNGFHGEIPRWIGNLTDLILLNVGNNFLKGQISCDILRCLFLDLSNNSLSGSLPSCFNQSHDPSARNTLHLNLQGNMLFGSIPEALLNSSDLLTLDLRDNNLSGNIPIKIGEFPNLRILSLAGNHLDGAIPNLLCQLTNVSLLDLSRNSFSGSVPRCLFNLSFRNIENTDFVGFDFIPGPGYPRSARMVYIGSYIGPLEITSDLPAELGVREEFEFVTKHRTNTYEGNILNYMSGLDLSQNKLTGEIPYELGMLSQIRSLNLSHNQLIGSIPKSFSNFSQLESLDLSYNNLSGSIPSELIELHFLSVFTVAHNNLSGKIPDMKRQFSTFESSSYEGNPFLCGPPLEDCYSNNVPPTTQVEFTPEAEDGKWYEVDPVVFFTSFSVSFFMFFLAVVTFLYVNPYWRQWLFYYSQEFMISCYYFLYDNLFSCLFVRRLYH